MNMGMSTCVLVGAAVIVTGCGEEQPVAPVSSGDEFVTSAVAGRPLRLFVGPDGDDGNAGTRSAPFRTVQAAVAAVPDGETARVVVSGGDYVENVTLRSNVSIMGRDPRNDPATIVGAAGQPVISGVDVQEVTIAGLSIVAADATSPGGSSIGISLANSTGIVISDNLVRSGNGAPGSDGIDGAAGGAGLPGGDGAFGGPSDFGIWILAIAAALATGEDGVIEAITQLGWGKAGQGGFGPGQKFDNWTQGAGGNGGDAGCGIIHIEGLDYDTQAGANGSDGLRGEFVGPGGVGGSGGLGGPSSDNPQVITSATEGYPGTGGPAGSSGSPGGTFGALASGAYVAADGGDGSGGYGGGGGGGGGGASGVTLTCGSGGGGGGQGGEGGRGGTGGTGGGGSFGIVITGESDVTISRNRIITADGGSGGRGGTGGPGGLGGVGGNFGITSALGIFEATCVLGEPGTTPPFGCGGVGAAGGAGGPGGNGGAGGGGPTIGIVEEPAGSSIRNHNHFYLGTPGDGGDGVPGESHFIFSPSRAPEN